MKMIIMLRSIVIVFMISCTTFGAYHEKTRFDRSLVSEEELQTLNEKFAELTFIDYVMRYVAHKNVRERMCYLEKMREDRWKSIITGKLQLRTLYPSSLSLTNVEAWKVAGGRIVDFCDGYSIKLLQEMRPIPADTQDPFLNEIPLDENDVIQKRITDVVLTPLLSRAKREIMLENRKKMNQQFMRIPRQTYRHGGKFRGQTQSQYLKHGGEGAKEGKAEAEATGQSSRALVSGTNGMGQAQSMSSGGSACEDCMEYSGSYGPKGIGIQPSTSISSYPSALIPGSPGSYPSDLFSPPGTANISGYVPNGVDPPGVVTGSSQSSYPPGSGPDVMTMYPRTGEKYPNGFQQPGLLPSSSRPGLQTTYPGSVLGVFPTKGVPSVPGTYSSAVQQPGNTGGRIGWPTTYLTGVQAGGVPGIFGTYPSGPQQPNAAGGVLGLSTTYPGSAQSSVAPGVSGTYSINVQHPSVTGSGSGLPITYPGGIQPSGISGSYPSGQQPSVMIPRNIPSIPNSYPSGIELPSDTVSGQYPIGGPSTSVYYPSGVFQPGTSITGIPSRSDNIQQPSDGVKSSVPSVPESYPIGVQQSGQQEYQMGGTNIPETYSTTGFQQPGTMTSTSYPGTSGSYPTSGRQPDLSIPGQQKYPASGANIPGAYPITGIQQPGTIVPGTTPGTSGTYPVSTLQPGAIIPGQQQNSLGEGNILYPLGTQRPGASIPGQQQYPLGGNFTPRKYPVSQQPGIIVSGIPGIYPGIGDISGLPSGIHPGMTGVPGVVYPGGQTQQTGYPIYPLGTAINTAGVVDDGADSHASSSVKQSDSETQASASSDGKFASGLAQSQVSGTYSGSGSFSAQAGTSDGNRGAQTQISGGKEGAMSNAQGMGGQGKSQAQVQLNSDTGATMTGAQSAGLNHGTNSQVQASAKGGMADAQANGEGNTSSQAQIGFQPYTGSKEIEKSRSKPFRGGGQASAQSGTYRGQSQSQIDGSFQYGITYTGAAQAGSGAGAGASRKPFNFTKADPNWFKSFEKFDPVSISKNDETAILSSDLDDSNVQEPNLKTGSSSRRTVIVKPQTRQEEALETIRDDQSYGSEIEEYEEEEYMDEDYDGPLPSRTNSNMVKTRSLDGHKHIQMIDIGNEKKHRTDVVQDSLRPKVSDVLQQGHVLPGYTMPTSFRGRVTSVSRDRAQTHSSEKLQAQTVSLASTSQERIQEGKLVYPETRSLKSEHERESRSDGDTSGNHHSSTRKMNGSNTKSTDVPSVKSNYFTVTKSIAGKYGDPRQKYEHRYYTKSSTCGYFTFSCNIVHGSNGRTKICKPKMPTYPDGTPMKC